MILNFLCRVLLMNVYAYMLQTQIQLFHNQVHTIQKSWEKEFYFNEFGLKLRNVRNFSIDDDNNVKRNIDHGDLGMDFERCQKLYSKVQTSAPGTSTLFLWFCADHGHCYGFHMTSNEGRKDPAVSLYSFLEKPP